MAKTTLNRGDFFTSRQGFGVVLPDGSALIVTGQDKGLGEEGYKPVIGEIPSAAHQCPDTNMPFSIELTLKAVRLVACV